MSRADDLATARIAASIVIAGMGKAAADLDLAIAASTTIPDHALDALKRVRAELACSAAYLAEKNPDDTAAKRIADRLYRAHLARLGATVQS